jgi:tetratricopeptide (TPR) repeat protein
MNKLKLVAMVLLLSSTAAFAQKNKVTSTWNYLRSGELDKAKEAIELAAGNAESAAMGKTWLYRAMVYQEISKSEKFKNLSDNPLGIAAESLKKCKEIDTKNKMGNEITVQSAVLEGQLYNQGVAAYQAKDFGGAIKSFENLMNFSPAMKTDTNVVFNTALSAMQGKDYANAKKYYNVLLDNNYKKANIYQSLSDIYRSEKDTAAAIDILDKGIAQFPGNVSLVIEQLNIYLSKGDQKGALAKLSKASELDPDNASIYFAQGAAFDNLKNYAEAEKSYKKAIEKNGSYFDAYYNLGAMYFNQAAELVNVANKIPLNKQKEFEAAESNYKTKFNQARPVLEKALELSPKDENTLYSLQQLYFRVGENEKSMEMKKRRETK